MPRESVPDRNSRPKRNKTELACDTCRKRKSRCDGGRPSCSHCVSTQLECVYRPPLVSLETDASLLVRLTHIETRLQALDHGRTDCALAASPAQETSVIKLWPQVPQFHHAAAHKMFNYWTNLRLNLDIPGLEPLEYVGRVDDNDTGLFSAGFETSVAAEISASVVVKGIESMFAIMDNLPFVLRHLFLSGGLAKEVCLDLFNRHLHASPGHDVILAFKTQSIEELLVQAIALKHIAIIAREKVLGDKADLSFRHALQQMWVVQAHQSPQALPFRFLFVIMLLYLYGRPYHALGILQNIEPLVYNTAPKPDDGFAAKLQYEACLYQYYLLESDILSEVDGVPSERLHAIIVTALTQDMAVTFPNVFTNAQSATSVENHHSRELQAHLQLRAYMNTILEHMYNIDRAYCRPRHVAAVVTDIARRLDLWYWTLPLTMRFPRHPSSFCLASEDMSHIMDELSFRYYATIFLVNRPILYHVLHVKYENAVNSSNPDPPGYDPIQDSWVFESCHNCVQNATMIILLHSRRQQTGRHEYLESWCNLQHLVAAYATILQVQTSAISILLQGYGDPDHLLDLAEVVLEKGLNRPANIRESLDILRNIRQNFKRSMPPTPWTGNGCVASPVYSVASHKSQVGHQS
ncbi:hypothetical protein FOPE_10216 [Fonsecaea pedrosoi]|nr:hypothetical protein FOPE_10216 [Fonsecaea pedrosoi]